MDGGDHVSQQLQRTVSLVVAAYGLVVIVANARNGLFPTQYTKDWVLFGGGGFPGDLGRNIFAGSIAFGVLLLIMAAVVWFVTGQPAARPIGAVAVLFGVLLLVLYDDGGNLLAARPGVAAVLVSVGVFLVASTLAVDGSAGRDATGKTRQTANRRGSASGSTP